MLVAGNIPFISTLGKVNTNQAFAPVVVFFENLQDCPFGIFNAEVSLFDTFSGQWFAAGIKIRTVIVKLDLYKVQELIDFMSLFCLAFGTTVFMVPKLVFDASLKPEISPGTVDSNAGTDGGGASFFVLRMKNRTVNVALFMACKLSVKTII
ncbi:hypothetical protein MNBD_BACTEROID07-1070 [hydrothermal vent metagenome]|uniref:Uncharacterized protein n=1 Tax=hydrothermal vent metagenome TaxID=652676 RepID=A0A3B0UYL1_9ZZZZ